MNNCEKSRTKPTFKSNRKSHKSNKNLKKDAADFQYDPKKDR